MACPRRAQIPGASGAAIACGDRERNRQPPRLSVGGLRPFTSAPARGPRLPFWVSLCDPHARRLAERGALHSGEHLAAVTLAAFGFFYFSLLYYKCVTLRHIIAFRVTHHNGAAGLALPPSARSRRPQRRVGVVCILGLWVDQSPRLTGQGRKAALCKRLQTLENRCRRRSEA